jgi:hypothetical protein
MRPYLKDMDSVEYSYIITPSRTHTTTKMSHQYRLWREIQDNIGEATTWPSGIRRLFWTKNIDFGQFVMLGLFANLNGLPPKIFNEWIKLNNMARGIDAKEKSKRMYDAF